MSLFFNGKIAIVTGASSGIGEATARLLAQRGATVVLAARRKEKLELLARDLKNSVALAADVTQAESVKNLVAQTIKKFDRIDILINNAGALVYKVMKECTLDELRGLMEINYFGAVACANAVLPVMRKQKSGTIVNIASIAGRIGFPNLGYYGASKFALIGFSEALRQEAASDGISVCTVCPGTVYTPMTQKFLDDAVARGKKVLPISAEKVAQAVLCGIEKKKIEVFVPRATHFLYFLHFFFPKFTEWLAWKFRASDPAPTSD